MTYLITLGVLLVLASLATALFFMLRQGRAANGTASAQRMARALAWRVGLSIALFVCILLAWKLGYIHPTGIRPGQ